MPKRYSRFRKRLGQHFLNSERLARRIINFAEIKEDVVLEIGAGKGIMTKHIANVAKSVYAVEVDKNLVDILHNLCLSNVHIINEDFLQLPLKDFDNPIIIGNIPYSITTAILEKLVKERGFFKKAVLTMQREYGDRISARIGTRKYGSISIYINFYFSVKRGFIIPPRFFSPHPKVSSIVISLNKKEPLFYLKDEDRLFEFIQGVFRYRRKSLKNAILNYLNKIPIGIEKTTLQKRPENLAIDDFKRLYDIIYG